jgi:hypothetical protein
LQIDFPAVTLQYFVNGEPLGSVMKRECDIQKDFGIVLCGQMHYQNEKVHVKLGNYKYSKVYDTAAVDLKKKNS